ncbi:MAG: glycosyltransferase family 39 protein [Planctomycetes bacterium]|nr:glycosyltransferase family 39 protein [Planctomycetota bacterium]
MVQGGMRALLVAAVLALSLALNCAGIGFGQPCHYDQSVDAIHPALSLDALEHLCGGSRITELKYPRTHFLALGLVQRAYLLLRHGPEEAARRQGELMAAFAAAPALSGVEARASFRPFAGTIGELIVVGRVLSALCGCGAVLALFLLARGLFGFVAGAIAAFLAAVSHPLVFYSHTLNVETPYLCCALFALASAVRAITTGAARWIFLAVLLAALSGAIKDQAFGLFILAAPLFLWLLLRPGSLRPGAARPFPLLAVCLAVLAAAAFYLALLGLPGDVEGFKRHFAHIFGAGVAPFREASNTLLGHFELLRLTFLHLRDSLGAPLLLAAAAGAAWMAVREGRKALVILLPIASYYLSFIALIGYVYLRFTLPILLLALVAAAYLCTALLRAPYVRVAAAAGLLLLLGNRMVLAVDLDRMLLAEPRTEASAFLEEVLPEGARVAAAIDLPMHNIDFPARAQVEFIDLRPQAERALPWEPDYVVVSLFPPTRGIAMPAPEPPEIHAEATLLGLRFELEESFTPAMNHPIQLGAAFQPVILVYRRATGP